MAGELLLQAEKLSVQPLLVATINVAWLILKEALQSTCPTKLGIFQ